MVSDEDEAGSELAQGRKERRLRPRRSKEVKERHSEEEEEGDEDGG